MHLVSLRITLERWGISSSWRLSCPFGGPYYLGIALTVGNLVFSVPRISTCQVNICKAMIAQLIII